MFRIQIGDLSPAVDLIFSFCSGCAAPSHGFFLSHFINEYPSCQAISIPPRHHWAPAQCTHTRARPEVWVAVCVIVTSRRARGEFKMRVDKKPNGADCDLRASLGGELSAKSALGILSSTLGELIDLFFTSPLTLRQLLPPSSHLGIANIISKCGKIALALKWFANSG